MKEQFQAEANSMRARDFAAGNKQLTDVEPKPTVLEQFLAGRVSK
jgi:hypothetical protein